MHVSVVDWKAHLITHIHALCKEVGTSNECVPGEHTMTTGKDKCANHVTWCGVSPQWDCSTDNKIKPLQMVCKLFVFTVIYLLENLWKKTYNECNEPPNVVAQNVKAWKLNWLRKKVQKVLLRWYWDSDKHLRLAWQWLEVNAHLQSEAGPGMGPWLRHLIAVRLRICKNLQGPAGGILKRHLKLSVWCWPPGKPSGSDSCNYSPP